MGDKKEGPDIGSEHSLLVGAGILFLCMAIQKVHTWFSHWIKSAGHQLLLAIVVGAFLSWLAYWASCKRKLALKKREREAAVIGPGESSVFCGKTDEKQMVFIKPGQRTMHTQVIGTTNAGKTESVILPWAIQDIQQGRGLLLIDGKADRSLVDKLWAYTVAAGREKDFRLFSLSNTEESQTFNPLIGGTAEEITERIFNAFIFENPFYRSVQYEVLAQVLRIYEAAAVVPTFLKLHQAISNPKLLEKMVADCKDETLVHWVSYFRNLSGTERDQRTSGLTSQISHFAFGKTAPLFNADKPSITIDEALMEGRIVYFQLPVLLSPFLGGATGKLVLQSLQAAVGNRHRSENKRKKFYSVFLDDFSEYLYPGFVTVLNKSRSANVGIVFAHQALGDIKAMGDAVANAILTNSNIKIFMRGNDPDSAEYFSKVIGTTKTTKHTERRKISFWNEQKTGDVSAREVEEFIVHPNHFKKELGIGQAVMVVPHEDGTRAVKIKFDMFPHVEAKPMPKVVHEKPIMLSVPVDLNENKLSTEEALLEALKNHNKKECA